jgi:hypothetical protein
MTMRFFNTAGPVNCEDHYCLPPLQRVDLDDVLMLLAQKKYFLLHAPRQTGKTSFLLALMEYLNRDGRYLALYANLETAQAARENVELGIAGVVQTIANEARWRLGDEQLGALARTTLAEQPAVSALQVFLARWCAASPQPVVLLLDEVDSLVGDTLIAVLRQLRAGYANRPGYAPQSVILCGVRDIQDYRIHSDKDKAIITGGSAFNIKAESLRMGDFTQDEVAALLSQHTAETGQIFTADALETVWALTQGQPWLVNALGYEACFRNKAGRDRSQPITAELIEEAKENLILARATHLDQLADKLREPRVRRIMEPMLAGLLTDTLIDDDRQYVIDLGLVRRNPAGGLTVANPIYREVIPRALAGGPQDALPQISPTWLKPDGSLDLDKLLVAFLAFWRQHGEPLLGSAPYHEIAPHLVLMAFLHRVVNGDGTLEREYAIGRGRMDLCLRYGAGASAVTLGIELKVWRDGQPDPQAEGLEQLDEYLDGLGLATGWLVLFDRRSGQPPIRQRTGAAPARSPAGRTVVVIRA